MDVRGPASYMIQGKENVSRDQDGCDTDLVLITVDNVTIEDALCNDT